MRIAFVSQPGTGVVPPIRHADSITIWTYEVARRLGERRVPVIYSKRVPGRTTAEQYEGIEYRRAFCPSAKRLERVARRARLPLGNIDEKLHHVYALDVARDVRRHGADVIHVHNYSELVPLLRLLNPKSSIVLHMHCEWLSQIDERKARRRVACVDRVLGCSDHVVSLAQRRLPEFADRMATLYNGVDVASFAASERDAEHGAGARGRHVLFVGRITPEKGLHDLLDAFELVLETVPDARLTIVGPAWRTPREYLVDLSDDPRVRSLSRFYADDDYLGQLRARMSERARAAVRFAGEVSRDELPEYYRTADILVNPSLSEAFGMSLAEAHASGVAVVATRVGGMQEIVSHEENGLLVPPAQPKELASALSTLLTNAEWRRRLGQTGRDDAARRFAWERIAEATLEHYARAARRA